MNYFPLNKKWGGMGEVAPRVPGTAQLGGFLLIALWSLLLAGGLPRGKAAAAFRLCSGASRLLSSRSRFCKVLSALWDLSCGSFQVLPPLTGPGPWPVPGDIALEPLVAESRMPWGCGQPLQRQGFCTLLQALFKLGKKVKYHLRTHE